MMTVEMPEAPALRRRRRATIATGSPCPVRRHGQVDLLAERLELLDGGRTVDVGGDEQRAPALFFEPQREFAGLRRLAGALQTDEHDDRRRRVGELQARGEPRRPSSSTSSSWTILRIDCAGVSDSRTFGADRACSLMRATKSLATARRRRPRAARRELRAAPR